MSKAYFFAIFLLAASFTGCLGDDELDLVETEEEVTEEEEIEEEETITPVGDETGLPVVEFLGLVDEFDSDIYLVAAFYDSDGYIKSYSIEDVVAIDNYGDYCGYGISMGENSTIDAQYNCYPVHSSIFIDLCYDLEHISQTVTVKVEDNDGNTASAEYELMADDFDVCGYHDFGPMVTLFAQPNNGGTWDVTVVQVGEHLDLNDFSFFLKDPTDSTYVGGNGFGEIAMQIVAGEERGIDASYDGTNDVLQERAADINGDDGTQYPVHFYDNDRDGMLTPGDRFVVHGTGSEANGPAENGWKLVIQYDPTGEVINWVRMEGMPSGGGGSMWDSGTGVWFDVDAWDYEDGSTGIWQVTVVDVVSYEDLYDFSFFLKDFTGSTYVGGNGFGEIAMQIVDGTEERGIDVSYDGDNVELQSRAGNISNDDGYYYPVHFYDDDGDGKLTPGDYFLIYGTGNSTNGPAEEDWILDIQFDLTGDLVGRATLV